jgi:hypothetical protein
VKEPRDQATQQLVEKNEELFNRLRQGEDVEQELLAHQKRMARTVDPLSRFLGTALYYCVKVFKPKSRRKP